MPEENYINIVQHYEECFRLHGDTPKGVDWPNLPDLLKRYCVMLDVIRPGEHNVSLLDFGCGTAMLKSYIDEKAKDSSIRYTGLDLGESFIKHCRAKFPDTDFHCLDVLKQPQELPLFDYIVMNGVFTERGGLPFDEMFAHLSAMLKVVFQKAKRGIAFNVMSKAVDWERDDLFHVSADQLITLMTRELSRHFVIRNDYGLYEYTVYLYKSPVS